jgi:Plasmid encoded RepA protein
MTKRRSTTDGSIRVGHVELPLLKAREQDQRKLITPEIFTEGELIDPKHIAYVPSIFLQCFLPVRHNEQNRLEWETGNRNAKLIITAGRLINPEKPGEIKRCVVPAGPKARIITAYINDYAYREKTPEIDLGQNLHRAMQKMNVAVCGSNARELHREVENVAAAEILMGLWLPDGSAQQKTAKVSEDVSFWVEKNPNQQTIWQPRMTLSHRYYASIQDSEHIAPVYWPALAALQHNARAMDIFVFLSYRLRSIPLRRPITLSAEVLHAMFGRDIKQRYHFWPRFLNALKQALEQYPQAQNSIAIFEDNSGIKLGYAPPLIPHRKIGRFG